MAQKQEMKEKRQSRLGPIFPLAPSRRTVRLFHVQN